MTDHLFVTGTPRSGTTLLDKLLSMHPRAAVLSQPLPLLFVEVKRRFLRHLEERGLPRDAELEERYPLNDMFGPHYYDPGDLVDFLDELILEPEPLRRCLESMVRYSGQYTKPADPFRILERPEDWSLHEFVVAYTRSLLPDAGLRVVGSKESFCEEFVPYFLAHGTRVVLLLRDPRDVIASLDFGRGREFGGRPKPHLFNVRQWRKSVAFALEHQRHERFLALRYEDLVGDPGATSERICRLLGLEPFAPEVLEGELRTADGEVWSSNSSHAPTARISTGSVGRYRELLPPRTDRFVQSACFTEMRRLGYRLTIAEHEIEAALNDGPEPGGGQRPDLASYVWSGRRRDEELARRRALEDGRFDPSLFLFEGAFTGLLAGAGAAVS